MRKIKFRAWDKESKWMIFNHNLDYRLLCMPSDQEIKENRFVYMQFIGLKDKNGKEIYEGDICKHPKRGIGEIIQVGVSFYFKTENNVILTCLDCGYNSLREELKNIKIIGNIYKNPDLMGVIKNE